MKTFQAEDEIATICSTIGASFGGSLGVTTSSGPGIALKTEAMGLALMLELPLVIVNCKEAVLQQVCQPRPSRVILLQAVYGRNGESPIPVIAAATPSDCFHMAYEACRIALTSMTRLFC